MHLFKKTKKHFLLVLSILNITPTNYSNYHPDQWVNIYIHGTYPGPRLILDHFDCFFFGKIGLNHISALPQTNLFLQLVKNLCNSDPKRFSFDHFYTFAWSGALCFPARKKAGMILYNKLNDLILDYKKKYDYYPKIRIITFSHGGNVALNMIQFLPFLQDKHIELELVIIACPVQEPLASYIKNPEIDFIYSISTEGDYIQKLDFYQHGGKYQFSNQLFDTTYKKCCQIIVSIDGHSIGHFDLFRSFLVHLPYTLNWADMNFNPNQNPNVLNLSIYDDKFISYSGLNLLSILYGLRKD